MDYKLFVGVLPRGAATVQVPFEYEDKKHVHLYFDGVEQPEFLWDNDTTVRFALPLNYETEVMVKRITPLSERAVDFELNQSLTEGDLDDSNIQVYHGVQEAIENDRYHETLSIKRDEELEERLNALETAATGGTRFVHWLYGGGSASGGETRIIPPYTFTNVSTVHINGVRQTYGVAYDYSTIDNSITFSEPLEIGDEVVITLGTEPYDSDVNDDAIVTPQVQPRQLGDGAQKSFSAPHERLIIPAMLLVFIDGVYQKPDVDYVSPAVKRIDFVEAPPAGAFIDIMYYKPQVVDIVASDIPFFADHTTTPRRLGERFAEVLNVHDYGAIGDGVTDDTLAIQHALTRQIPLVMVAGKTYLVKGKLEIGGAILDGRGATIKCEHTEQIATITSGAIRNLIIDGDNKEHTSNCIEFLEGEGATIENVLIKDIHGVTTYQTYAVKLPMFGAKNFAIKNTRIENVTQDDDGAVTGKGFVGGIYFYSADLGTQDATSSGVVSDVTLKDIYSVGDSAVQDSDAIRCYHEHGDVYADFMWNITFRNITTNNVGKRVFKTGGLNGCIAENITCIKDTDTYGDMYSIFSLTNGSSKWTISNVVGRGFITRGIELAGREHSISGLHLHSTAPTTGYGVQVGATYGQAVSCKVTDCVLNGFNGGIYVYNGVDNVLTDIVSRNNAISFFTNAGSVGNSTTVVNLKCFGGLVRVSSGYVEMRNINIQDVALTNMGYAFQVDGGSARVRGLYVLATLSALRPVNIALKAGSSLDIDDVNIVRSSAAGAKQNDHCVFTTQDSVAGSDLRIGKMRVVSNANPSVGGGAVEGRQIVLIKNVNLRADSIEVINNAAVGSNGNDLRLANLGSKSSVKHINQRQLQPSSSVSIEGCDDAYIGEILLDNGFNNSLACFIGTVVRRGGAAFVNAKNTPVDVVIPNN